MRPNPVRQKLRAGGTAYGIMAAEFFTPGFCQIAGDAGAEFVIFDMEHGGVGIDVLKAQIAFARGTGISPFVRVPGLAYHLIAPVLDAGAMGIMVPMIETREQAENLARWCRYSPEGVRGLGFGAGHDDYRGGNIVEAMGLENDRTLVIALIETAAGIANADAILSVPGIDVGWLVIMISPTPWVSPPNSTIRNSMRRWTFCSRPAANMVKRRAISRHRWRWRASGATRAFAVSAMEPILACSRPPSLTRCGH